MRGTTSVLAYAIVLSSLVVGPALVGTPVAFAQPACESFRLEYNQLDLGWGGHGRILPGLSGGQASLGIASVCTGTDQLCASNADCAGVPCVPSCDPGTDSQLCRLIGPVEPMRCLLAMTECVSNADCVAPDICERVLSPPIPVQTDGVPICMTVYSTDDITGTFDPANGDSELALPRQLWRVHLGLAADRPCPRCGAPAEEPTIGATFACEGGGSADGRACRVDAVSPYFGGVSYDCPPTANTNVSGPGLGVRFGTATTRRLVQQATLPCAFPLDAIHPNGSNPLCLDDFSPCATNADCTRCTDDFRTCTTNADCAPGGQCAEAPDQPISCGLYCHCGFCANQIDQPCFLDADCAPGVQCVPGIGGSTQQPQPQIRPNACGNLLCGESHPEQCCTGSDCVNADVTGLDPVFPLGVCSLVPYRTCDDDTDCAVVGAGSCERYPVPCFGNRIEREGIASPAAAVCASDPGQPACATNGDCSAGPCTLACAAPVWAALACVANTTANFVNGTFAIPGPATVLFNGGFAPPVKLPSTTTSTTSTTTTTNTTVTTLPSLACPEQPSTTCFEAGQAAIRLRNAGRFENRVLVWRWRMGEPIEPADFADPTADTDYVLCAYDSIAGIADLASQVSVPAGNRWRDRNPDGFVYVDPTLSADGVKRVRLKTGLAADAAVTVAAFGLRLPLPPAVGTDRYFEQDPRVMIQLVASTGTCWTSAFGAPDVIVNRPRKFRASTAGVE